MATKEIFTHVQKEFEKYGFEPINLGMINLRKIEETVKLAVAVHIFQVSKNIIEHYYKMFYCKPHTATKAKIEIGLKNINASNISVSIPFDGDPYCNIHGITIESPCINSIKLLTSKFGSPREIIFFVRLCGSKYTIIKCESNESFRSHAIGNIYRKIICSYDFMKKNEII